MKILKFTAVLAALALAMPAHAKDNIKVVSSSAGAVAATAYVAKQLGYFDEVGLNVELIDGGGGSNAVASVVGGSAQIGIVGIKNTSEANLKGQTLKVVGTAIRGFPLNIIVRSDLFEESGLDEASSLKQKAELLRGRTVAVNDVGGSSGDFVRFALAAAELGEREATIINVNNSAGRLAGLRNKRLDAIVAQSPEFETAIASDAGTLLVSTARDIPSLGSIEYMIHAVREDYLKSNPDIVERYLSAIKRAQDFIQAEPEKAKEAFYAYYLEEARGAKLDPEIADAAWNNLLPYLPASIDLQEEGLKGAREFFKISEQVPDEELVDNTLARKLAAQTN